MPRADKFILGQVFFSWHFGDGFNGPKFADEFIHECRTQKTSVDFSDRVNISTLRH
jgi:hypothetical protein